MEIRQAGSRMVEALPLLSMKYQRRWRWSVQWSARGTNNGECLWGIWGHRGGLRVLHTTALAFSEPRRRQANASERPKEGARNGAGVRVLSFENLWSEYQYAKAVCDFEHGKGHYDVCDGRREMQSTRHDNNIADGRGDRGGGWSRR